MNLDKYPKYKTPSTKVNLSRERLHNLRELIVADAPERDILQYIFWYVLPNKENTYYVGESWKEYYLRHIDDDKGYLQIREILQEKLSSNTDPMVILYLICHYMKLEDAMKAYANTYYFKSFSSAFSGPQEQLSDISPEQFKAFYKTAAKKLHPDSGGDSECMKVLNKLNEIFKNL